MEENKTGLGLALFVICVMACFFILAYYIFPNRSSIVRLIICFLALKFWGGVLLFASTHIHKSFLFRLLAFLFRGKDRMYLYGILAMLAGFFLFPIFFAYGWI
ncbi:hypothetical protein [Candidatus Uabimicrobium sp. HlEnr_7]|uniref:hypothetical protein n=1 Tax=Candidatus Uabimicrobium helgolandensis TaxID=3095367 RepID=UPI003557A343